VARVTRAALLEQKWSTDRKALKIIYVCGNEPASQDPVHKLKDVARMAVEKDVVVNTIFCGPANSSDANDWKEFARLAEGRFASIDQQRGVVAIATPHDKKLAELSARLNSTYVAYGKAEAQKEAKDKQQAQDANANKQGGVAAARAATKASNLYRNAQWDLVDRLKEDPKFDLKKLKEEELCEEMRKLKPEEREAYVKKKAAERLAIQKEIQELAKKRDEYIREQNKKNPTKGDQAFDAAVRGALRDQAAKKGIKIPD
jgi:pantothenate synthetase